MSADRRYDVVALGGVDLDIVVTVDRLPGHDEKVLGRMVGRLPGGTVANFACAAGRLGLRVAALATVGQDEGGRLVVEDYRRYGVDTSHVTVRPDLETHFTIILVDPSGERAIVVVPMFEDIYDVERGGALVGQSRALYAMPRDVERFLDLAGRAREAGALIMVDLEPDVAPDLASLEPLLSAVDVASFNRAGLEAAGEEASVEGARRLLRLGPHTIVTTLGKRGSLAVTAEGAAEHPGFAVPVKDTTGAGDTFNAAFLKLTLEGRPLAERLAFANAAAALSVTGLGPRGRLPTAGEVDRFLARGER